MRYAPDWRVLNELQRAAIGGTSITASVGADNYDELYIALKNKEFKKMRTWVANNQDVDVSVVFRNIYDNMYERVQQQSIPQLVLILAEYQYKNALLLITNSTLWLA